MERPSEKNTKITALIDNIERIIVGKRNIIELVLTAMLAGGHVLIEDVPGVGKTQLVSSLAHSCGGQFGRLQLTPDVMPTDITGFSMIDQVTHKTEFRKGAAFCNFLLADEINRASPKTQSALLEIMEEMQVTVDGNTYALPSPFMVLATQNPVETYGTYHLPEAQMDRFIMKISMGYPDRENELSILRRTADASANSLQPVLSCEDIILLMKDAENVDCSTLMEEYIVDITNATRNSDCIKLGASPRGSIALYKTSKAFAFINGRSYVVPDDVKAMSQYVLSHRIILSSKGKTAFGTSKKAVDAIVNSVPVPTPIPHKN